MENAKWKGNRELNIYQTFHIPDLENSSENPPLLLRNLTVNKSVKDDQRYAATVFLIWNVSGM